MKNEIIELQKKYNHNIAIVMYEYASGLLDLVEDDEILDLYKEHPVFAKISTMSNDAILEDRELLEEAIHTLEDYLSQRPDMEKLEEIMKVLNELDERSLMKLLRMTIGE